MTEANITGKGKSHKKTTKSKYKSPPKGSKSGISMKSNQANHITIQELSKIFYSEEIEDIDEQEQQEYILQINNTKANDEKKADNQVPNKELKQIQN